MLSILLSFFSLYPWNIGGSVYGTLGNYSDGREYLSKAVYVSMDRRGKDGFVIGYEDLEISNENENYHQYNLVVRDIFWIKSSLRFVGIVGHLTASDSDDGWLWGTYAEGDLPWFGYSIGYIHSDYHTWSSFKEAYPNREEVNISQWDASLSKLIGDNVIRFGFLQQDIGSETNRSLFSNWTYFPSKSFSMIFSYVHGKSRYSIDPDYLTINNNPDILKNLIGLRILYRFTPNWSINGIYSHHIYDEYTINYIGFGIQARF